MAKKMARMEFTKGTDLDSAINLGIIITLHDVLEVLKTCVTPGDIAEVITDLQDYRESLRVKKD